MGRLMLTSLKILMFALLITSAGCGSKTKAPTPIGDNLLSAATLMPTIETPTADICNGPPSQISKTEISNFHWSDNSENIIFQEKGTDNTPYIYNIANSETHKYNSSSDKTEASNKIVEVFGVDTYVDYFISPNQKLIIYTQSNQSGYAIYLKHLGEKEPSLLGKIQGSIDQNVWINNGNKLILTIDWSSPLGAPEAYIYLVDIIEKKVKVIIPHAPTQENVTYIGITPDGNKILFASYSGNDRFLRVWDMRDNSTTITKIQTPLTLKWLSNNKEFIAAGYQIGYPYPVILIYNIEENSIRYLSQFQLEANPYIKNSIQISPNTRMIAFIGEGPQNLYLINCNPTALK